MISGPSHIALLQDYFQSRGIEFGSEKDLLYFAGQIGEAAVVREELACILRSILYAENLRLGHEELLDLLCVSLGGEGCHGSLFEAQKSGRDLILFVNRALRSIQTGSLERAPTAGPSMADLLAAASPEAVPEMLPLWLGEETPLESFPGVLRERRDASVPVPGWTTPSNGSRRSLAQAIEMATAVAAPDDEVPAAAPKQPARLSTPPPLPESSPASNEPSPGWHFDAAHLHATLLEKGRLLWRRPALLCGSAALAGFAAGVVLPRHALQHRPRLGTVLAHQQLPAQASPPPKVPTFASNQRTSPRPQPVTAVIPSSARASAAAEHCVSDATARATSSPVLVRVTDPQSGEALHQIPSATACGLLLSAPPPEYPTLASMTKLEGDVSLAIVISPQGTVTATSVLDGPPLLRGAAEQAVRHWRFQPYLQGGRALAVQTHILVPFRTEPPHAEPGTDDSAGQ